MTTVPNVIFIIVLIIFALIVVAVLFDRRKHAKKNQPRPRKKFPPVKKTAAKRTAQPIPTAASLMRQQIADLIKHDPERVRRAIKLWMREK